MSQTAARLVLLGLLAMPGGDLAALAQAESSRVQPAPSADPGSDAAATSVSPAPADPRLLPLAPVTKGPRPRVKSSVVAPAATELPANLTDLPAPDSLALPNRPEQVGIKELRPLTLAEVEALLEVNNPELKAIASRVDQEQSELRRQIALWYPSIELQADTLPSYNYGETYTRFRANPAGGGGRNQRSNADRWSAAAAITAQWSLIDPQRNPSIAAARDRFERAKYEYVVSLRELRLQAAEAYFDLQQADDQVRIGQESVRASLVSLRDSRARFQAGVATKLEVLEAETQLARDQQLLTEALARQAISRRALASLLDLPQSVSPTAQDPSRVLGVWQPSLQESIVAAYAFREELDQVLLDISIANSNANIALGEVQPFLRIFAGFDASWFDGSQPVVTNSNVDAGGNYDLNVGLSFSWRLFDGGAAAAQARRSRQAAQESSFRFAQQRDQIRIGVEESFYELEKNNRNITTTAREVTSARESLRLARLRFQAGVTTQREVVDNQRDLTQAEVRYANAIADYNKRLAQLRRRTGLDRIALCPAKSLPAMKPVGASDVPVEPTRLLPACQADQPPADALGRF